MKYAWMDTQRADYPLPVMDANPAFEQQRVLVASHRQLHEVQSGVQGKRHEGDRERTRSLLKVGRHRLDTDRAGAINCFRRTQAVLVYSGAVRKTTLHSFTILL